MSFPLEKMSATVAWDTLDSSSGTGQWPRVVRKPRSGAPLAFSSQRDTSRQQARATPDCSGRQRPGTPTRSHMHPPSLSQLKCIDSGWCKWPPRRSGSRQSIQKLGSSIHTFTATLTKAKKSKLAAAPWVSAILQLENASKETHMVIFHFNQWQKLSLKMEVRSWPRLEERNFEVALPKGTHSTQEVGTQKPVTVEGQRNREEKSRTPKTRR